MQELCLIFKILVGSSCVDELWQLFFPLSSAVWKIQAENVICVNQSRSACWNCCTRSALWACFTWKLYLTRDVELMLAQVEAGSLVLVEVKCGSQEGSEQYLPTAYSSCCGYLCTLFPEQSQFWQNNRKQMLQVETF